MNKSASFTLSWGDENQPKLTVSYRVTQPGNELKFRIKLKDLRIETLEGSRKTEGEVTEEALRSAISDAYDNQGHPSTLPTLYHQLRELIEFSTLFFARFKSDS